MPDNFFKGQMNWNNCTRHGHQMKCTAPGRNIKGKPNDIAVKICKKTISSRLNFVLLFKFVLLALNKGKSTENSK